MAAESGPQPDSARPGSCPSPRSTAPIAWASACGCLVFGMPSQSSAAPLCEFAHHGLQISGTDDTATESVDLEVRDGPLVLTRATIPTEAGAAGCWQTDLDADRQFEIVLGLKSEDAGLPLRLKAFEWNGALLEPFPIADLPADAAARFGGDETIEIVSHQLLRAFSDRAAGQASDTQRLHFRYAAERHTWTQLKALRPPKMP